MGVFGTACALRSLCRPPGLQPARSSCALRQLTHSRARRRWLGRPAARSAGDGGSPAAATPPAGGPPQQQQFDAAWLGQQALVMAAASAILGPLCDGQHSSHNVLHYVSPAHLSLGPLELETCWWVPILFGLAGVILGVSHPLLDSWQAQRGGEQPRGGTDPSWAFVLAGIAFFVLQYAASGALEEPLLGAALPGGLPALDAFLLATGVAHWWAFDGTRQGLFMACLTAVAGPAVEIGLINLLHLYSYTHPAFLGVPTWIAWVYFCGGPAVGNLGRKVSSALLRQRSGTSSSGSTGSPTG